MTAQLLDYSLFQKGVPFSRQVPLDVEKPHLLVIGASGSGKTYASTVLLAQEIYNYYQQYQITPFVIMADYKADKDFEYLNHLPTFFRFDNVDNALDLALTVLESRQKEDALDKRKVIFFIDEWGSYLASKETKQKNEAIQKLSRLMMLGRSFDIQVVISNQRGDADYFGKIRDNFSSILALGNLSKETVQMFFSDEKEIISLRNKQGVGYLKVSSKKLVKVVVPSVTSEAYERCQNIIRYAVESSGAIKSLLHSTD